MSCRILYFRYMDPTAEKKQVTPDNAGQNDRVKIERIDREPLTLFVCSLAPYYGYRGIFRKKKMPWNQSRLLQTMQQCCVELSADAYYVEQENVTETLLDANCQRIHPEIYGQLLGKLKQITAVLYLPGESENSESDIFLPDAMLRGISRMYLYVPGNQAEQDYQAKGGNQTKADGLTSEYGETESLLEQYLWREYGMPLVKMTNVSEMDLFFKKREDGTKKKESIKERLLVIDDRAEMDTALLRKLPAKTVYLDMWSAAEKCDFLQKKRPDVRYLSEFQYLRRLIRLKP